MAFDEELMRRRVRAQLLTASPLPAADNIAWQNVLFDPPPVEKGESWIRESFFPVNEVLAATQMVTVHWRCVYDVFVPVGFGTSLQEETTRGIVGVFYPGQWLQGPPNDCPLHVVRTERLPARKDPETLAWYMQAVSILIRAHVPNPSLIS